MTPVHVEAVDVDIEIGTRRDKESGLRVLAAEIEEQRDLHIPRLCTLGRPQR